MKIHVCCGTPLVCSTHKSTQSFVDIHMAKFTAAGQQWPSEAQTRRTVLRNVCPSSCLAASPTIRRTGRARERDYITRCFQELDLSHSLLNASTVFRLKSKNESLKKMSRKISSKNIRTFQLRACYGNLFGSCCWISVCLCFVRSDRLNHRAD